ncbi:hypothetical protein YPPY100_4820, partial [Yersinia pestis PY-100]
MESKPSLFSADVYSP